MRSVQSRATVLALVTLLAACSSKTAPSAAVPPDEPPADALTSEGSDGPVTAKVEVWPAAPVVGDAIHLRLTVTAKDGAEVDLPTFDQALGRFSVVSWTPVVRSAGANPGETIWRQGYALQAPMSGRHRIPRLRVEWTSAPGATPATAAPPTTPAAPPAAGAAADTSHELLTDEIKLEISTALPEGSLVLKDSRGALDPEVSAGNLGLIVGGPAVLVLLIAGFFLYRGWRRQAALRIRVSAYEVAMRRLATLEQAGLPDATTADPWYVELSGIVRRYLEDRYAVRAPELTTEEFLREAQRAPELSAVHRELLSQFLEDCDRVKFAGYRPDAAESQRVLGTARAFVEDTRLRVDTVARAAVVTTSEAA